MSEFKFRPGQPACPVGCRYCFITEHDIRRGVWNQNPVAGINKACTYVNVPPWIMGSPADQQRFRSFPFDLLRGDVVGFTAITDPFWPKLREYLWYFLDTVSPIAKAVTCVSKWPISEKTMQRLSKYPNFYLVLGVTGNWTIENTPLKKHLRTLELAKKYGVPALPISHPYIAGLSDFSHLPFIKDLGYEYFDVKGLRYCNARMGDWMPEASKRFYQGHEDEEILPEDGWREKVSAAGLGLLSPKEWYWQEIGQRGPHIAREEAEELVEKVLTIANVTSSDKRTTVRKAAIRRRL